MNNNELISKCFSEEQINQIATAINTKIDYISLLKSITLFCMAQFRVEEAAVLTIDEKNEVYDEIADKKELCSAEIIKKLSENTTPFYAENRCYIPLYFDSKLLGFLLLNKSLDKNLNYTQEEIQGMLSYASVVATVIKSKKPENYDTPAKEIIKELLLNTIEFRDYLEQTDFEEYNEYNITDEDKDTFSEEMAERILRNEFNSLDEIQELADSLGEELFHLQQDILGDALGQMG